MRHLNQTCKLNRTTSHRRCMFANMLKSLIFNERIQTTVPKAKALRRYADRMITLAKKNTLSARRQAIGELMIRFNTLTPKEQRAAKGGDTNAFNDDRFVIAKLFDELGTRFVNRNGGYTRIIKQGHRVGDNAHTCIIEYLAD
ncbi:MAG: 50S ribosomal protein L17 [Candidatus Protochlamydia sp.]|nr:50S ribosomal protein L17 [Candidatus Protochlamydia sp.]